VRQARGELAAGVVDAVNVRYAETARELVDTVRKTESSLKRMKSRQNQGATGGAGYLCCSAACLLGLLDEMACWSSLARPSATGGSSRLGFPARASTISTFAAHRNRIALATEILAAVGGPPGER
jgi:hypothetical protein